MRMRRLGFRDERKWAIVREARKLGTTFERLEQAMRHIKEIGDRADARSYCEGCGRKVYDGNLDEPEILPHGSDEDGLTICDDCGNAMAADAGDGAPDGK